MSRNDPSPGEAANVSPERKGRRAVSSTALRAPLINPLKATLVSR